MTPDPVTMPATPATPAAPAAPSTPAADLETLQRENADLKRQQAEATRTAEFWYQRASASAAPPAPAAPVATPEPAADVDVLDLATKGGKAFEAYLDGWARKSGYVKGPEMSAAMTEKAQELAKQGELVSRYPELRQPKRGEQPTEFFQATAAEYGQLVKRGYKEADAMEIAAERTELNFLREGKMKTPTQIEADRKTQAEADRRARAAAGGGDRGTRSAAPADDDDTLDADQQSAVRQLANGLDISIEEATKRYIARAKQGVNMTRRA